MENNKGCRKKILLFFGGTLFVAFLGVLGIMFDVIQIGQTGLIASQGNQANSTLIALQEEELYVQQRMLTAQSISGGLSTTEKVDVESPTSLPEYTSTIAIPTNTSIPTDTVPPEPSIMLPFSDNFNSGLTQEWDILSGNWITSDGWLTMMESEGDWDWVVLNDPTWKNYRVKVRVFIYAYGAANQEPVAVAVRISRDQRQFLGFYVDTLGRGGWSLIGSDRSQTERISGYGDIYSVPQNSTWELEVIGNQFIAYINGREYQKITISGFNNGGIGLGIICTVEIGCPEFDDLTVETIE